MHSIEIDGVIFHHDGDLGGETKICDLSISTQILVEFVAGLIRDEKIARLEQATTYEVLGLE